jgi:RNA polymerase sigma-70 factor (ECF subfamily)
VEKVLINLEALQSGDELAWQEASPGLWDIASSASIMEGLTCQDAEDVANKALTELAESVRNLKSEDELCPWLFSTARRRSIDLIRRNSAQKRPQTVSIDQAGPNGGPIDKPEFSPDCLAESDLEELRRTLSEILDQVSEPARSILKDRMWLDCSYQELSQKYGMSEGAIRTMVCRTVTKLSEIISKSPSLLKRLREFLR